VSGDPVKNKNVIRRESGPVEERNKDLSGEGKMPVFEKQTLLKNTPDKINISHGEQRRGIVARENIAKLGTKIKVMGFFSEESVPGDIFTEGTFSGAGRTKEQGSINRNE
jgi:hypothetical protein